MTEPTQQIVAWNEKAQALIEGIKVYEDEHPKGSLCLYPLLEAADDCCATQHGTEVGPRHDGRRADWDTLTPDQKVQAALNGTEFAPKTLEQRVADLEEALDIVHRNAMRAIDIANATQNWSPGR